MRSVYSTTLAANNRVVADTYCAIYRQTDASHCDWSITRQQCAFPPWNACLWLCQLNTSGVNSAPVICRSRAEIAVALEQMFMIFALRNFNSPKIFFLGDRWGKVWSPKPICSRLGRPGDRPNRALLLKMVLIDLDLQGHLGQKRKRNIKAYIHQHS